MKKYLSALIVLLAVAAMFSGCGDSGKDEKTKTVITLSQTNLNLEILDNSTITATTTPADAALTWTSSVPSVATVADGVVTAVSYGTATITATAADGEKKTCAVTVTGLKLNLNTAAWPSPLPPMSTGNMSNNTAWPTEYAATSYSDGKLIITFNGKNRQRAIIPISEAQTQKLLSQYARDENGVTFRIEGTVKNEDGSDSDARFRCHIGNPSITGVNDEGINWNATSTGAQTALKDHLVEYVSFDHPYDQATEDQNLKWFMIQAMYWSDTLNADNDMTTTFPKVIITVSSITIDIGKTFPPEED